MMKFKTAEQMDATLKTLYKKVEIEDLKEYRNEIITEIKKHTNNVSEVMKEMVSQISSTKDCDEIEYTRTILCEMGYFNGASEKLAQINRENARKNLPSSMR